MVIIEMVEFINMNIIKLLLNTFTLGVCKCGCNSNINIRNSKGLLAIYKNHHNLKDFLHLRKLPTRNNHHNYKGGRRKRKDGYIIMLRKHHKYGPMIFEHRYVMELMLGRYLEPHEVVHHINGIKTDNRIENLMLFENHSKHKSFEQIKDMSDRICVICNSNRTKNRCWYGNYSEGFVCVKCHKVIKYHTKKLLPLVGYP